MKSFCILALLILFSSLLAGCQAAKNGYQNPAPFNNGTMGVLMIDQSINVNKVDGLAYNETGPLWGMGNMRQPNLTLLAGSHTIEISRESLFFHTYSNEQRTVHFTVAAGEVYRLLPYTYSGEKTAAVFHEDTLIARIGQ